MSAVFVVHLGDAALDRDAVAGFVAVLRKHGHEVVSSVERSGLGGGELDDFDRCADAADHILLVDPNAWWRDEDDALGRAAALRERVELCLINDVDRIALIHANEAGSLAPPLRTLAAFVLPGEWFELLAHLRRPRVEPRAWQTARLLRRPRPWFDRPELDAALDRAVELAPGQPGKIVWLRGGIGTGKTCLLLALLARREAAGLASVVHVARPGLAATRDPRALSQAIAAASELADVGPTVIVIDGLELIPAPFPLGPLPTNVVLVVASRPLAPGVLGELRPTIDLDAPGWAAAQQQLVAALLGDRTASPEVGSNPAAARALVEHGEAPLDALDVPRRFELRLERAFARLRRAPIGERRLALAGLALLRVGVEPLPASLIAAALGAEAAASLERHAAEWIHRDAERLTLAHPLMARFLAAELGPEQAAPHLAIVAVATTPRRRARLDADGERYVAEHAELHRQYARGLTNAELKVRELSRLQQAAAEGTIEELLEHALAASQPDHAPLLTAMRTIVRQESALVSAEPSSLAPLLWAGLVARGFLPSELTTELNWADALPRIRLQNRLSRIDRCDRILRGHADRVRGCGISDDASLAITVGSNHELRIWEPLSGRELDRMDTGGWTLCCALTPDGARAAVSASAKVLLIDPRSASSIAEHEEHEDTVTALAISRDGAKVLSADRSGVVVIWDVATGSMQRKKAHSDRVNTCALSEAGLGATAGNDKKVCVWSIERGTLNHTLRGHRYTIGALAFTRDGDQLASIGIGETRVWDAELGREVDCYDELGLSSAGAVTFGAPEQVIAAESGERVWRWSFDDGALQSRFFAHPVDMNCIAVTPDGEWILTGGDDRVARLWRREEAEQGDPAGSVLPLTSLIVAGRPGAIWVGGGGRGTRLVELGDPEAAVVELEGRPSPYALAELDEVLFAVGSNRRITTYSSTTGAELAHWDASSDWLRTVAIDEVRQRVACGGDEGTIFVLSSDLDTGEARTLRGHTDWIHALAFVRDGRLLAVDADGRITLWDVDDGAVVLKLASKANTCLYAMVLDATTDLAVVAGAAGVIEAWAFETGELRRSFTGHQGSVRGLALTPDDRFLLSAGHDGSFRIWSFADGRELAKHDTGIPLTHAVFVGDRVVVGTVTGDVMIFEIDWSTIPT